MILKAKVEDSLSQKRLLFKKNQEAALCLTSHAVGDFYGTGIEIWAGFGPVWQLLRTFFHVFMGKKLFLKTL